MGWTKDGKSKMAKPDLAELPSKKVIQEGAAPG